MAYDQEITTGITPETSGAQFSKTVSEIQSCNTHHKSQS